MGVVARRALSVGLGVGLLLVAAVGCDSSGCPEGTELCRGRCVEFGTQAHCRWCGDGCREGTVCLATGCGCPEGLSDCGAVGCVDLDSRDHCGRCSNACGDVAACVSGACACPEPGQTLCGTTCLDTQTSTVACGGCGGTCAPGEHCIAGTCGCPAGNELCGIACRLTTGTDPSNCGGCDIACGATEECSAGLCHCPLGQASCGDVCVDVNRDDARNCGACGRVCDLPAGHGCSGGSCSPSLAWIQSVPGSAGESSSFRRQRSVAVAVDAVDEHIYVAYSVLTSFSSRSFVVALDRDGSELWQRSLGSFTRDAEPVAIDARAGRLIVAITDGFDVSRTVLLDSADGTIIDNLSLGSATTDVELDAEGGFIVVGEYRGSLTIGDITLRTVTWHTVFVLRFDAAAVPVFGFALGNPNVSDGDPGVALAEDGSFYVAAEAGGLTWTKDGHTFPGGGWLAAFGATGVTQWVAPASLDVVLDVELGSAQVFLHGSADSGTVGGVRLAQDTFVAGWSLTGTSRFVRTVDRFAAHGGGMVFTRSRIHVTNRGSRDYTLGPLLLSGSNTNDALLAAIDVRGTPTWLTGLLGSGEAVGHDTAGGANFLVLVGRYTGTLSLPGVSLPSVGRDGVFVSRFDL